MKKFFLYFTLLAYCCINLSAQSLFKHGQLQVTKNGHYLQFADGTPFFWLGDTGWELFHRLNLTEIKQYLDNRSAKGYTVIQAVALAEMDGLRTPNQYGELPLKNLDPAQPNEKYFILVDSVIHMARQRNLFIGLLPTWGDKVAKIWGEGPVIFDSINAYVYGKWIGNRYRNEPNIIWILGGADPLLKTVVIGDLFGMLWQKVLLKQQTIIALLVIIRGEEAILHHNGYIMNDG